MQVRAIAVARVAEQPEHIADGHLVALGDGEAAGLQMDIDRVLPVADVDNDVVAPALSTVAPGANGQASARAARPMPSATDITSTP